MEKKDTTTAMEAKKTPPPQWKTGLYFELWQGINLEENCTYRDIQPIGLEREED